MKDLLLAPWIAVTIMAGVACGVSSDHGPIAPSQDASTRGEAPDHRMDRLEKKLDDLLWYERVGDVAAIDKVRIYGPPRWKESNPTGIGAGNHVKFYSYLFTPRAEGKDFEYEVFEVPGGHSFDRLDTPEAWRVRRKIYEFLARYLAPPQPAVRLGIGAEGLAAP